MKKFKNLKLSKKTISSLTNFEMSYVKGAYGFPAYYPNTPPQSTLCPSAVCPTGVSGAGGGRNSQYGCPTPGNNLKTSLYGTFTSQGCAGLSTC
jgi:hypothetical protein